MTDTEPVLLVETRGRVRHLTLNRPDRRNALNEELNGALVDAIMTADHDPEVYAIAITGAGSSFCSGADLSDARARAERGEIWYGPLHNRYRSLFEVMIDSRTPTIAVVNGPAVAGGFELALSCDIRVAADNVFFAVPESRRGRGAHYASIALPRMVPQGIAMEWLYTGRRIELAEAERWGLVNRVAPEGELQACADELLTQITGSAPLSLERLKLTYRRTESLDPHAAIRLDVGPDVYSSEDQKEGALSFLEKRQPRWQGR